MCGPSEDDGWAFPPLALAVLVLLGAMYLCLLYHVLKGAT